MYRVRFKPTDDPAQSNKFGWRGVFANSPKDAAIEFIETRDRVHSMPTLSEENTYVVVQVQSLREIVDYKITARITPVYMANALSKSYSSPI